MSELPSQFMVAEQASPEPTAEQVLNPDLAQARLRVQTIQRFQALNQEIVKISDPYEQEAAQKKLDVLAKREYGRAWEVLKKPDVEVTPMMIGGKTKDQLKQELRESDCLVMSEATQMIENPAFTVGSHSEPIVAVRVTVGDLGWKHFAFLDKIYKKIAEFGLALCPAEVGPQYCLQTSSQLMNEHFMLGMKQDASKNIFLIGHIGEIGPFLKTVLVNPDKTWQTNDSFLFCLPTSQPEQTEASNV